jgi:hypothetical protein
VGKSRCLALTKHVELVKSSVGWEVGVARTTDSHRLMHGVAKPYSISLLMDVAPLTSPISTRNVAGDATPLLLYTVSEKVGSTTHRG